MATHPWAGKPAPAEALINVDRLLQDYAQLEPNPDDPGQRVSFGTSGHRGTSGQATFNDAHIAAVTQALVEFRTQQGNRGPIFLGKDTHALSASAEQTALEVLAAHGVETVVEVNQGVTPTPVISHAILTYNRGRTTGLADGIIITPSHNPPQDGGFKYNPPNGGPADVEITNWVQQRANELLKGKNRDVRRLSASAARSASCVHERDFAEAYIADLEQVVDLAAVANARVKIGVDPLGGAAVHYWDRIAERYGLSLTVVNRTVDPRFAFMTADHDGQIRMDCSSPDAMAGLIALRDQFDVAWANDPDADRHGIVTRSQGLMNPNHYLATAIWYLFQNRPEWPRGAAIGKTLVSSGLIDRVGSAIGRVVYEVPVGFKWFVDGLFAGTLGFGGEESAGASFLRRNGKVWSTDKDGLILGLLAAEILAKTGKDPGEHYLSLAGQLGTPYYTRIDQPASPSEKAKLKALTPTAVTAGELAGSKITSVLTAAPGNGAAIGGLKVVSEAGWFAARPSGTENIYKIYAESFRSAQHLQELVQAARELVAAALA